MAGEQFLGLTAQKLMVKREEVEAELRDHFNVLKEVGQRYMFFYAYCLY